MVVATTNDIGCGSDGGCYGGEKESVYIELL